MEAGAHWEVAGVTEEEWVGAGQERESGGRGGGRGCMVTQRKQAQQE